MERERVRKKCCKIQTKRWKYMSARIHTIIYTHNENQASKPRYSVQLVNSTIFFSNSLMVFFFIFTYRQPFCTSGVCVSALMSIAVDAVTASFCCQRLTWIFAAQCCILVKSQFFRGKVEKSRIIAHLNCLFEEKSWKNRKNSIPKKQNEPFSLKLGGKLSSYPKPSDSTTFRRCIDVYSTSVWWFYLLFAFFPFVSSASHVNAWLMFCCWRCCFSHLILKDTISL